MDTILRPVGCILLRSLRPPQEGGRRDSACRHPALAQSAQDAHCCGQHPNHEGWQHSSASQHFYNELWLSWRLIFPESQSPTARSRHVQQLVLYVLNIHLLALREVTICPSSLLSRLLPSPMALIAVTAPMGGCRWTWKQSQDNPSVKHNSF